MSKKILIFTDTHSCQTNGVTKCLDHLASTKNHTIKIVSADDFVSVPVIGYKEIRLSLAFPQKIVDIIQSEKPDAIHIMTEGPIGFTVAFVCKKYNIPYTTTFHTKFPEYLYMRSRLIRPKYVHKYLHFIHNASGKIFVSHEGLKKYLKKEGYTSFEIVPLGINHSLFFPGKKTQFLESKKPIVLFVGRIAVEKNIEDFLKISDNYTKIVVGDGPLREEMEALYPSANFVGIKKGRELAEIYRSCDVFVFPSKTDTLGLVNLEAMASGKPVVAYDIEIMSGVIENEKNGVLVPENQSLETGIEQALALKIENITQNTEQYDWEKYQSNFVSSQISINYDYVDYGNL